jgi:hypothetical protein
MSLFGGDNARPSLSPSPSQSSPSPSVEDPAGAQNAQNAPLTSFTLDSETDDDNHNQIDPDALEDDEDESELKPSRPNRFTGHPGTWQRYTAADRQIAASLEKIDSEDLTAHLYNTHNLKRRLRRPAEKLTGVKSWQGKDAWLKKGEDLQYTDPVGETETELIPPKSWTAWPVPPNQLPHKKENVERADSEEDTWYIGAVGAQSAGEVMREEILALMLRQAKEQWLSRESDQEEDDVPSRPKPRAKSEGKGVKSDVDIQDQEGRETGSSPFETEPNEKKVERRGKKGAFQQEEPLSKPTFLADDDEARRILQPSVNSLLTRLDGLALGLRRSRLNHLGKGAHSDRSESEFGSDTEQAGLRAKRLPSRAQSKSHTGRKAKNLSTSRTGHTLKHKEKPSKKPKKPETEVLDDSDSVSDYGADHEDEIDLQSSSSDESSQGMLFNATKKSRKNSDASSTNLENARQVGLMDWSEVLGVASMTGWNERAVARAAQRCAALFGEGMSFRTFDEASATQPVPEAVQYTPSTIPDFGSLSADTSSNAKRPYFDSGTLRCPHKDCWGSEQDFKIPYRTIEHVIRVHDYDPRTNDSDNEERTLGGVHIDGFLQPISLKRGWVGAGRGRSKSADKKTENGKGKGKKKQKVESERSSPDIDEDIKI